MSFKSIIQDMRGEFGSISRKGFEGRFGRSRSHRVVEDCTVTAVDALRQSCWANMPPELLRDVLMRIEEFECDWPLRKHVVACAGVCRSWREIMKEIVRNLEESGKVTYPISVKQVCVSVLHVLFLRHVFNFIYVMFRLYMNIKCSLISKSNLKIIPTF